MPVEGTGGRLTVEMKPAVPAHDDLALLASAYPYYPALMGRRGDDEAAMADHFHVLLKEGGLQRVKDAVTRQPELLAALLPIVANPEASINVRIGASVVFEAHAGSTALRDLLPRLIALSENADRRVRADACFYLGLSRAAHARDALERRLDDVDADVREIAADALAELE